MKQLQEYESLSLFMLNVTALLYQKLPTATVERTFSKINVNKRKLREIVLLGIR